MQLSRIALRSLRLQWGKVRTVARVALAGLALSAAGLVAIVEKEGWCNPACLPTAGDVPTLGFGNTTHEDGRPVKMGDTTTPVKAVKRTLSYLQDAEAEMKRTLAGVELTQDEYDLWLGWRYQFGGENWRRSKMLRELKAGNHREACDALLEYRWQRMRPPPGAPVPDRMRKRDCSLPENWGPQGCRGVWLRAQENHRKCLQAGGFEAEGS